MFIRSKFVTNSSSTSFIYFGLSFGEDEAINIIEKWRGPEHIHENIYETLVDDLDEWAAGEDLGPIRIHMDYENLEGIIYIDESHYELGDGSCIAKLPIDHLFKGSESAEQWTELIHRFCEKWGVTRDQTPAWFVACDVPWA